MTGPAGSITHLCSNELASSRRACGCRRCVLSALGATGRPMSGRPGRGGSRREFENGIGKSSGGSVGSGTARLG